MLAFCILHAPFAMCNAFIVVCCLLCVRCSFERFFQLDLLLLFHTHNYTVTMTSSASSNNNNNEEDPREPNNCPPLTLNPDLACERSKVSFNPLAITNFIDGSQSATSKRRLLESWIIRDPTGIFNNDDNNYLHRSERHTRALAKFVRLVELCRAAGIGGSKSEDSSSSSAAAVNHLEGEIIATPEFLTLVNAISDDPFPTSLHWVMFVPNILTLCDADQQAQWLPLCRDWKMIGCYAQTELGHGSNIRALETTATFLKECDGGAKGGEWIIHSPTITSTKFWPGTLGKTANHAMVIARLIDGSGVDHGIHNFLVPLRSMDDHTLLPGVETGDIGPKIGYNNMDNGFAHFTNVKIPRRNMAMRFAFVDEEGNYKKVVPKGDDDGGSSGGGNNKNADAASKVACKFDYIIIISICVVFWCLHVHLVLIIIHVDFILTTHTHHICFILLLLPFSKK